MQEEINQLKAQVKELQDIVLTSNLINRTISSKKTTFKDIVTFEKGIRIVHKTTTGSSTYIDIVHGSQINDAGIKAEMGYTAPNGSLYCSSSVTQPFFVMYNTTWILVNLP